MQSCSDYKELPLLVPRKWQRMTGPPAKSRGPGLLADTGRYRFFLDCRCAAQTGRRACPQKQNPAGGGVLPAQRMAGIGEIGAIRALTAVSRAISDNGSTMSSQFYSAPRWTVFAAAWSLKAMASICRPNYARQVGAGRALVCDQPILLLEGRDLVTSRSVFLPRGHAKLPCLLEASATTESLPSNFSERQRGTDGLDPKRS